MSRIATIVDFTKIFPEDYHSNYNFNPAVAHWKDDLYLCAYRNFSRGVESTKSHDKIPIVDDPNHPWLGGAGSATWWGGENRRDQTGFLIMSIKDEKIERVKALNDGKSLIYTEEDENFSFNTHYLEGVDARLLHIEGSSFLLSFNKYERDRKKGKGSGFSIYACVLKITKDMKLKIYPPTVTCEEISSKNEKNWSFWMTSHNKFRFSYNLAPYHVMYGAKIDKKGIVHCDTRVLAESIGYFGILEKRYNDNFGIDFHVSLTTPAIPRKNSNSYIGVGHVKYQWQKVNDKFRNPLSSFQREHGFEYSHHPIFDYFMFIYEFNPTTGNIISLSDMFIPEDTMYLLAFPSGITYLNDSDNIAVFYGDHDSFSKMIVFSDKVLSKLLKTIEMKGTTTYKHGEVFHAWNSIWPNPKFFFFPEVCEDVEEICEVFL